MSGIYDFSLRAPVQNKPLIGISACLTGEPVRYDGTDKYLTAIQFLSQHLALKPLCPEVGAGMPIPRPPVQLVSTGRGIEAIGRDDPEVNPTQNLLRYSQQAMPQLEQFSGYIFKSRSPSCGAGSTPIYNNVGEVIDTGSGLHARQIQQQLPWLPLREETDLATEDDCRLFIRQCWLYRDIREISNQQGLEAAHQHCRYLIDRLSIEQRQGLEMLVAKNDPAGYWQMFLTETTALLR